MSNFYKILGVSKNATKSEIRKAYLLKAKQYHPDLNRSNDSLEKFKLIQEAYQTLYNQNSRSQYDQSLNNKSSSSSYGYGAGSHSSYYGDYGNQRTSFKDQFRSETEHLHRQWRDMEQERLRRATEDNFQAHTQYNQGNLHEFLNDIFKVLAMNTFIGNRFKFFIYMLLRILPAMAMPLFFLLAILGQFKSFGSEKLTIVYDSYGRAYIMDSEGRRRRIPSLDKHL